MIAAFTDAFWDCLAALPWLLVIYIMLELLEVRFEGLLKRFIARSQPLGPLVGALVGCVPQCGFSMIASALYCHRSISLGTLLAVYLSTSDEAVPIILAQPNQLIVLAPLLFSKVLIAMAAGFALDAFVARPTNAAVHQQNCHCVEEAHLCAHRHDNSQPFWKNILIAPAYHTLQVFLFILAATFAFNLLLAEIGEARLHEVLLQGTIFQPLIAVLIGLIPNCAASAVITQVFLKGGISFGSAVAGLCASSGLGLIVLLREAPTTFEAIKIVGLLAGISFLAGLLINVLS